MESDDAAREHYLSELDQINECKFLGSGIMSWHCTFTPLGIRVNEGPRFRGYYNFIEDPYCEKCHSPGVSTERCSLQSWVYGFNKVYALGKYQKYTDAKDNILSSHIRFLKMGQEVYSDPLGHALSLFIRNKHQEVLRADYVVPVPAYPQKRIRRGFNQSELILNRYCYWSNQTPLLCLEQVKDSDFAGRKLGLSERYEEVKGMFRFDSSSLNVIAGKYVLLLDDVVTCGSQSSECSRILLDNGASMVDVIALGRTGLEDAN